MFVSTRSVLGLLGVRPARDSKRPYTTQAAPASAHPTMLLSTRAITPNRHTSNPGSALHLHVVEHTSLAEFAPQDAVVLREHMPAVTKRSSGQSHLSSRLLICRHQHQRHLSGFLLVLNAHSWVARLFTTLPANEREGAVH